MFETPGSSALTITTSQPQRESLNEREKTVVFFPNLDALRFFSFLSVFFAHSFAVDNASIQETTWYQIFKGRMFSDGDIGVSFFFVLSGFLITYLLIIEKEKAKTINVKSFYIRRALRIWPLYYFCVGFGFFIFPLLKGLFGQSSSETASPYLCSLFLNNFNAIINGPPDSSVLSVLWSVAIEEQFYLVWPLFFFFLPTSRYHYVFVFVILLSIFYRLFASYSTFSFHTFSVISDMAIGGLGAYLCIFKPSFLRLVQNGNRWIQLTPYVAVILLLLYRREFFGVPVIIIFSRIISAFFFAWIILEQNFCKRSIFKLKNLQRISILGKYTYGLYCLHTIALLIIVTFLSKIGLRQQSWQLWLVEMPLSLGLSIAMAYTSYHILEKRFLSLKSRFSYIVKDTRNKQE
jgi:peptidoglycan/LPS O-acetylase OafA/YrhL